MGTEGDEAEEEERQGKGAGQAAAAAAEKEQEEQEDEEGEEGEKDDDRASVPFVAASSSSDAHLPKVESQVRHVTHRLFHRLRVCSRPFLREDHASSHCLSLLYRTCSRPFCCPFTASHCPFTAFLLSLFCLSPPLTPLTASHRLPLLHRRCSPPRPSPDARSTPCRSVTALQLQPYGESLLQL